MDKPNGLKILLKNVTQWLGLSIFDPNFGSNMDKPKYWVKNLIKIVTQWLGLSIFDPKLGLNNPAIFRVKDQICYCKMSMFPFLKKLECVKC